MKIENPTMFQVALPAKGENEIEVMKNLLEEIERMNADWKGNRPLPIPMVPEILTYQEFIEKESVQNDLQSLNLIPIGVDYEDVESVAWDNNLGNLLLVTGKQEEAQEIINNIIKIKHDVEIILFDEMPSLMDVRAGVTILSEKEEYESMIEKLHQSMTKRKELFINDKKKYGAQFNMTDFNNQFTKKILIINGCVNLVAQLSSSSLAKLAEIIQANGKHAISVVIGNELFSLQSAFDDVSKIIKRMPIAVVTVRLTDQNIFNVSNKNFKEVVLTNGEAYMIKDNNANKIKLIQY
ncbi:YukA superfamily protein [Listeria weihenstephanensis FSL R9-0317]|uniref:Uncharacterized protein n=1 Tax=Listeria weihenstephanensis TaxID=1006155 RepID=A0A1S7FVT0_9LIST|nr:hypothetical protein [Listeria weihenstephanensis]AQY51533.1 hypothetical protein UE46_11135 [Listeria weihenstephanensis]EUJ39281.1 YukA superfamily protein [Listeria weihenstephanensis FSL R9-0317]